MALVVQKAPTEVEDLSINWVPRGLGTDTIATSVWSVSPTGLGLTSTASTFTTTTTTVWLSGGTLGQAYTITNTITTSGGRTFQQEITCFVYQ